MIDTINEKLAIMEFGQVWEPGVPISPSTLGQDDKQQLLWGFPGVLWASAGGFQVAWAAHVNSLIGAGFSRVGV